MLLYASLSLTHIFCFENVQKINAFTSESFSKTFNNRLILFNLVKEPLQRTLDTQHLDFLKLVDELTNQDFVHSKNDYSPFIKKTIFFLTIMIVYVDNIIKDWFWVTIIIVYIEDNIIRQYLMSLVHKKISNVWSSSIQVCSSRKINNLTNIRPNMLFCESTWPVYATFYSFSS